MVVAAIPGLGVTCIMPAETILSGIQKRWQDARQELSDLVPIEAISAEEILAASISKSYVPDPNNSLLTGTGRERFQDGRGVSAGLVPHYEKSIDPQSPISKLTTEIEVLQEKLNTVNEEVQRLENQLKTANRLHNIAKQNVTQLQQEKENLRHRLSAAENKLDDQVATLNSRLDSLDAEKSGLGRASRKWMHEADTQAISLRRDIETLKTQAPVPLTARDSGLFGPSSSASTDLIITRAKPSREAGRDFRARKFWIPDAGIERDVITYEITRYLGVDALVISGRNNVRLWTWLLDTEC
jgi:peptidoglycan hydrolase CwlO-like protein